MGAEHWIYSAHRAATLIRHARLTAEVGEECFVSPGYAMHDELVARIASLYEFNDELVEALKLAARVMERFDVSVDPEIRAVLDKVEGR